MMRNNDETNGNGFKYLGIVLTKEEVMRDKLRVVLKCLNRIQGGEQKETLQLAV